MFTAYSLKFHVLKINILKINILDTYPKEL